jgi:uncharacterized membrane-anchored protein YhcB (DUF1043 family)
LSSAEQNGRSSYDQTDDHMSDYIADLQVHMALQARNLLPRLDVQSAPSPAHQAQADVERYFSRNELR